MKELSAYLHGVYMIGERHHVQAVALAPGVGPGNYICSPRGEPWQTINGLYLVHCYPVGGKHYLFSLTENEEIMVGHNIRLRATKTGPNANNAHLLLSFGAEHQYVRRGELYLIYSYDQP